MATVGDYLKKEREARNLSVQDVAARTKISLKYILCIENDDYDQLPRGPYVKGYISAYALQVCGDTEKALRLYASCHPPTPPETSQICGRIGTGDDPIAAQSRNGDEQSVWRAGMSTGLSILRGLSQAIPTGKRRSYGMTHDEGSSRKGSHRLESVRSTLLNALERIVAHRVSFLKMGVCTGLIVICSAVLVFAGFGVYHVFIYEKHPAALTDTRRTAQTTADHSSGDDSTRRAAPGRTTARETAERKTAERPVTPSKMPAVVGGEAAHKEQAPLLTSPVEERAAVGDDGSAITPRSDDSPTVNKETTTATAAVVPINLIRADVCTAVTDRMPVGTSDTFPWTSPRIFVWSLVGTSDPPARVHHIYYHRDKKVGDVVLKVGSDHWRTWSFRSLGEKRLQGSWRVDIASDEGRILRSLYFVVE